MINGNTHHTAPRVGFRYPLLLTLIGAAVMSAAEGPAKPPKKDEPPPDDEDEELDDKTKRAVNKIVHGALTEHEKRSAPKRAKELETQFGKFGADLLEKLGAAGAGKPAGGGGGGGSGSGGAGGTGDDEGAGGKKNATAAENLSLQKQLNDERAAREKLAKDIEEANAKTTAAETRARKTEEVQLVTKLLTDAKVRPTAMRMATGDIHSRFIVREKDDEGNYGDPMWKQEDGTLVTISKGFAKYLATDEGRDLLPAINASGGGARKPGAGGAGGAGGGGTFTSGDLGDRISGGPGRRG